MTFVLVAHLQQKAYSVSHVYRMFGISRSGYYVRALWPARDASRGMLTLESAAFREVEWPQAKKFKP